MGGGISSLGFYPGGLGEVFKTVGLGVNGETWQTEARGTEALSRYGTGEAGI